MKDAINHGTYECDEHDEYGYEHDIMNSVQYLSSCSLFKSACSNVLPDEVIQWSCSNVRLSTLQSCHAHCAMSIGTSVCQHCVCHCQTLSDMR